ncbi:MAG TPA: hypothetical protein VLU43_14400 [Anaeromyxobacteraceae bacterium]|nr:hypothetical protein [Anaeromyxobacteraceae bacterium]
MPGVIRALCEVGIVHSEERLARVSDAVKAWLASNRISRLPGAPQLPLPPLRADLVRALRGFIQQEVSAAAATSGEAQRTGASHG